MSDSVCIVTYARDMRKNQYIFILYLFAAILCAIKSAYYITIMITACLISLIY